MEELFRDIDVLDEVGDIGRSGECGKCSANLAFAASDVGLCEKDSLVGLILSTLDYLAQVFLHHGLLDKVRWKVELDCKIGYIDFTGLLELLVYFLGYVEDVVIVDELAQHEMDLRIICGDFLGNVIDLWTRRIVLVLR